MTLDEELIKDGYESYRTYTLNRAFVMGIILTDGRKIKDVRISSVSEAKVDPREPSDLYILYIKPFVKEENKK